MEKSIVGKWYRHRGNKNSVPERVKKAPKNYDVIVRYRDGIIGPMKDKYITRRFIWRHDYTLADIMAYQFVEKK